MLSKMPSIRGEPTRRNARLSSARSGERSRITVPPETPPGNYIGYTEGERDRDGRR